MSDEKPPEKPTVQMVRPPDWAIALTEKVTTGFAAVNERLGNVEANIELQGGSVLDVGKRVTLIEERLGKTEERLATNSVRARSASEVDVQHDATIASIVTDVALLKTSQAKQTAILERLDAIAANPMVRRVAYAIGGLILTYLAARGVLPK